MSRGSARSSMGTRLAVALIVATALLPGPAFPQPAGVDSLAIAEAMIASGRSPEALDLLLRWSEKARSARLDGLIATCCCELPEKRRKGLALFHWLLDQSDYEMSESHRRALERDARACGYAPVWMTFSASSGNASVSGSPKLYFFLPRAGESGQSNPAEFGVASEPLEPLPSPPATVRPPRVFPLDSLEQARARSGLLAGPKAVTRARGGFAIASTSAHDGSDLLRFADQLTTTKAFLDSTLRLPLSNHAVTIYLVPSMEDLRAFARRRHGLAAGNKVIGYSFPLDQSIVAVIPGDRIGTLKHELVHTLVSARFPDLPPWLDEGLAALYEESTLEGARVVGVPGWRQRLLREFWGMRPSLSELLHMDRRGFDAIGGDPMHQAVHHAMARTLLLYLQERGKIAESFAEFRPPHPDAPATDRIDAQSRLAKILGVPKESLESEFVGWFEGKFR